MGKFSDYVGSINEQTNILRENLTNATGVDCSKKSIGACADVVADYVPDLEKEEVYYDRPSWYPDIKAILNSAPEIEKDGVTYVPAWIVLLNNLYTETPFYYTHSTSASAVNYYRSTGGDAVLCSDKCNNDINNANADSLEIGKTIIHTWDTSKDISDTSGEDLNKVRWAIIYQTVSSNSVKVSFYLAGWKDCIEVITGNINLSAMGIIGSNSCRNNSIKYIELQKHTKWEEINNNGTLSYFSALEEIIFDIESGLRIVSMILSSCNNIKHIKFPTPCTLVASLTRLPHLLSIDIPRGFTYTNSSAFLVDCYNLEKIRIPSGLTSSFVGLGACYNLKEIVFESGVNIGYLSSTNAFASGCYSLERLEFAPDATNLNIGNGISSSYNLKYVKIPSSVENVITAANAFGYTTYIELFNDFNISAVDFTGQIPKELQWLRDLCVWLKDRTGDTANTMIIGSANLENAQNLWLTFNPDNKRDITWVDAGTEGAINIVEFITTQLNWTLS